MERASWGRGLSAAGGLQRTRRYLHNTAGPPVEYERRALCVHRQSGYPIKHSGAVARRLALREQLAFSRVFRHPLIAGDVDVPRGIGSDGGRRDRLGLRVEWGRR